MNPKPDMCETTKILYKKKCVAPLAADSMVVVACAESRFHFFPPQFAFKSLERTEKHFAKGSL